MTEAPTRSRPSGTDGREIGALIGGAFGMVFVAINSTGLAPFLRVLLLVVAAVALVAIVLLSIRSRRSRSMGESAATPPGQSGTPFGRRYWTLVGIEGLALFGGSMIITRLGHPELGVAWVAFVVGTHFFVLARIFGLARFHLLGAIVTALGIAGFAIRGFGSVEPIAIVSGVLSGFVLLAFALMAFAPVARGAATPAQ